MEVCVSVLCAVYTVTDETLQPIYHMKIPVCYCDRLEKSLPPPEIELHILCT